MEKIFNYSDLVFAQNLANDILELLELDNERSKKLFKILEKNNPFKIDEQYEGYTFEDLVNVMEEEIDDYENLDEEEFIELYGDIDFMEREFVKEYIIYIKNSIIQYKNSLKEN